MFSTTRKFGACGLLASGSPHQPVIKSCGGAEDSAVIVSVFSPSVFGPALARALDGLLAVQAHDARSYASSTVEVVALCGSMCLQPRGDDFYAADQLTRHYYVTNFVPVAFSQIPGLANALGGLSVLDIRQMLKARWENAAGSVILSCRYPEVIASVFSPSVFGPALARALDGLLAVQAHDARSYVFSTVETVALCGSMCLFPGGDDFYAADQLSRHYYASSFIPAVFNQIPGLSDALGGLNVLDIRRMLKARWDAVNGIMA
jgi:hypothetical protein